MSRTARHAAPARVRDRRRLRPLGVALGLLLTGLLGAWVLPHGAPAPVLAADTAAAVPVRPAGATPDPAPPLSQVPPAPEPPVPSPPPGAPSAAVPAPPSACGAGDPVVVASGPLADVAVCDDAGTLTYRAARASDGASVVLPAARTGSSWTARSGQVTYILGDGELLITRAGAVLEQQALPDWWQRPA